MVPRTGPWSEKAECESVMAREYTVCSDVRVEMRTMWCGRQFISRPTLAAGGQQNQFDRACERCLSLVEFHNRSP